MMGIECNRCGTMISVTPQTYEMLKTLEMGTLCDTCQKEVKAEVRQNKINKIIKKPWWKIW